jgi:hypothetical protein
MKVISVRQEGRVDGERVAKFDEASGEGVQISMPYFWRPCKKICHSFQANF